MLLLAAIVGSYSVSRTAESRLMLAAGRISASIHSFNRLSTGYGTNHYMLWWE